MRKFRLIFAALVMTSSGSAASADAVSPRYSPSLAAGCTGCHGLTGQGYDSIPAINRKSEGEFVRLMQEFRSQRRRATVMDRIAKGFNDEQIAALARYFSRR